MHCNDPLTLFQFWFRPEALSAQCEWALGARAQPTQSTVIGYLTAFLATNALEAPFYFWLLRRVPLQERTVYLFSGNLLTHPAVYFLFPFFFFKASQGYGVLLTFSELFAFGAETLFIYFLGRTRFFPTVFWIVTANLFSWWIGVFVF